MLSFLWSNFELTLLSLWTSLQLPCSGLLQRISRQHQKQTQLHSFLDLSFYGDKNWSQQITETMDWKPVFEFQENAWGLISKEWFSSYWTKYIQNNVLKQDTHFTSLSESFLKLTRLLSVFVGSLLGGCGYGNWKKKEKKNTTKLVFE